jgi:hypothetical protein
MNQPMKRLIRQIGVRNEERGEETVYEFANFREFRTARGVRRVRGRTLYALSTGEAVSHLDDDRFELISTGEALFRIRTEDE